MSIFGPAQLINLSYQASTTNSTKAGVYVQHGWGFWTGTGAANNITKAVTFPLAYTTILGVIISSPGGKSAADPTAIGDFVTANGNEADILQALSQTTSGFTASITAQNATNLANGFRYGFVWVAFGIL